MFVITETGDGNVQTHKHTYKVKGKHCECMKLEQSGLPCSHLLKTLEVQGLELTTTFLSSRWVLPGNVLCLHDLSVGCLGKGDRRISEGAPAAKVTTVNGRFVVLLSQAQSIASIASKNAISFDRVLRQLEGIEQDLLAKDDPVVVDDKGVRSGRKPAKRKGR